MHLLAVVCSWIEGFICTDLTHGPPGVLSGRSTSQMGINYHGEWGWYTGRAVVRSLVNKLGKKG